MEESDSVGDDKTENSKNMSAHRIGIQRRTHIKNHRISISINIEEQQKIRNNNTPTILRPLKSWVHRNCRDIRKSFCNKDRDEGGHKHSTG